MGGDREEAGGAEVGAQQVVVLLQPLDLQGVGGLNNKTHADNGDKIFSSLLIFCEENVRDMRVRYSRVKG